MSIMPVIAADADSHEPEPNIPIRVTIPEEFMGMAIGEINARKGFIIGMEHIADRQVVEVNATLPESEFDDLRSALLSATLAAKVERREA